MWIAVVGITLGLVGDRAIECAKLFSKQLKFYCFWDYGGVSVFFLRGGGMASLEV
jgi:hypothetical protein